MNLEFVSAVLLLLSLPGNGRKTEKEKEEQRQVIMYPQRAVKGGSALIMLNGISNNNQSSLDEQQLYTISNNLQSLSNLVTSQTNLINTLSLELAKLKRQLVNLDMKAKKDDTRNQTIALKEELAETQNELTDLKDALNKLGAVKTKIKQVDKSINSLESDLKKVGDKSKKADDKQDKDIAAIKRSMSTLSAKAMSSNWPKGSYCILASGRCPKGFERVEGHLKSLYMYSSGRSYVKEARFGDSVIGCYGRYCGQYGNWIGKLEIRACCK